MTQECPFCSPEIEGRVAFDGRTTRIILARDAIAPGQLLVIPKRHVARAEELSVDELSELMIGAACSASALTALRAYDGFNLLINSGEAAGQTVPHVHMHVVPRVWGDTRHPQAWLHPSFEQRLYQPGQKEQLEMARVIKQRIVRSPYGRLSSPADR